MRGGLGEGSHNVICQKRLTSLGTQAGVKSLRMQAKHGLDNQRTCCYAGLRRVNEVVVVVQTKTNE